MENEQGFWIAFGSAPTDEEVAEARAELESIGVIVGEHDGNGEFQGCEVSDAAFDLLDPKWGRFIWG